MTLYVGEAVRILAKATDPESSLPLDPAPTSAVVDFWSPDQDRQVDTPIISDVAMTYRSATNDFVLFQSTSGEPWVAGKWVFRVTVTGSTYQNWEISSFKLTT